MDRSYWALPIMDACVSGKAAASLQQSDEPIQPQLSTPPQKSSLFGDRRRGRRGDVNRAGIPVKGMAMNPGTPKLGTFIPA